ncbi:hypothetical protein KUL42_38970 [Alteromonas sp. KUL42]|uniref:hypothetical protein n=1 Tax=Alteromonas sp. KUL42 TaxID=2480797 RepID=UPI001036973A|nr:hypothetical protein [Alteromonas sp. KUL42]TAP31704.1 hypothetical protein EYR97_19640 [Alteromonas sp. KUL42]GEA09136.1 hypothetical protein KUL42_38970 [Alteromonas sp. KUL42]
MKKKNALVNVLLVMLVLFSVSAFGIWYLEVDLGGVTASESNSLVVPNGFSHMGTKSDGTEIVHNYTKQPPPRANVTQTSEDAYAKYVNSLPTITEKVVAEEFKTLNVSLQNAKLYADTTELFLRGRENEKLIRELDGVNEEEGRKDSFVTDESIAQRIVMGEVETEQSLLNDIVLKGIVGDDSGFYAVITDVEGKYSFKVKSGQKFKGSLVVTHIDEKYVVISDGTDERTINVM